MTSTDMPGPLTALNLIVSAWGGAIAALRPAAPWLLAFALTGALYAFALNSQTGFWAPLATAILTFLAGTQLSRRIYSALMPAAKAPFLPLAHANLAVYAAFLFIGFFIGFFLLVLPGILIEAAGNEQIGKDADPAEVQAAFLAMLATPYGAVFILCCAAGAAVLVWIALRLTLYGAATADSGQAQVFRTWGLTGSALRKLALASLVTHGLPFALAALLNAGLQHVWPETPAGIAAGTVAGILLFSPFLLLGHAMAAAAWQQLKPPAETSPGSPPGSGD